MPLSASLAAVNVVIGSVAYGLIANAPLGTLSLDTVVGEQIGALEKALGN